MYQTEIQTWYPTNTRGMLHHVSYKDQDDQINPFTVHSSLPSKSFPAKTINPMIRDPPAKASPCPAEEHRGKVCGT